MTSQYQKMINFPVFTNKPGPLMVAEIKDVTEGLFDSARRVYWIVNDTSEKSVRGGHYHPEGGKQEILVCVAGKAVVKTVSVCGSSKYVLDRPSKGLVMPSNIWHEVIMEPGAVLISIASTNFSPKESITDYPPGSKQ